MVDNPSSSPSGAISDVVLLARIDERLDRIQSDTLPEMKTKIDEARDGSITAQIEITNLNSKVDDIRDTAHTCVQAQTIGSMDRAIKILITVAVIIVVPSGAYILNDVRADASIENNITNNAKSIKTVSTNQAKQNVAHNKQLKNIDERIEGIPSLVRQDIQLSQWEELSDDEFEDYIKLLPERDKRRMRLMWRRARLLRQKNIN